MDINLLDVYVPTGFSELRERYKFRETGPGPVEKYASHELAQELHSKICKS